jgi:hypothetical protein
VDTAIKQAASSMQPARIGFGLGVTSINVSRDVPTPKGWAQGSNSAGFSDKSLPVVRIESVDGKPLAVLYNPAVRSVVMDGSKDNSTGGKALSADLSGAASRYVEQWYGGGAVALFLMGAGVDQAPVLQADRSVLNRDGSITQVDLREAGFTLLDLLGERLGSEVIQASEAIKATAQPKIEVLRRTLKVPSQGRAGGGGPPNGSSAGMNAGASGGTGPGPSSGTGAGPGSGAGGGPSSGPVQSYIYPPGPDVDFPVIIMRIGELAIAGIRPELASSVGAQIKAQSPFPNTMVVTMADGGAKYMVDAQSYDRFTAEARGSGFARGAAALVVKGIDDLLTQMKQSSAGK